VSLGLASTRKCRSQLLHSRALKPWPACRFATAYKRSGEQSARSRASAVSIHRRTARIGWSRRSASWGALRRVGPQHREDGGRRYARSLLETDPYQTNGRQRVCGSERRDLAGRLARYCLGALSQLPACWRCGRADALTTGAASCGSGAQPVAAALATTGHVSTPRDWAALLWPGWSGIRVRHADNTPP